LLRERDAYRKVAIQESRNADRNARWDVDIEAEKVLESL